MIKNVKKNIPLAPLTTFNIGGNAKYFLEIKCTNELVNAVQWANRRKIPYFILGGGSNVLVSDKGFQGLVIKMRNTEYKIQNTIINVGAGMELGKLISLTVKNKLSGLEYLIGIPGTIGGAIRGNAGACGHSISEAVKSVKILTNNYQTKILNSNDCQFNYRESIFKQQKLIVLSAEFQLKEERKNILQKRIIECSKKRKNQPLFPNAGSIFKNPSFEIVSSTISKKFPKIKEFKNHKYIPAGWLIEQAGLKGTQIGQAQISQKHANFLINLGHAKADSVIILISLIKQKIRDKFGIQLQEEIDYV